MQFKCFINILLLITFFSWVFHVTFNSRNTLLENPWSSVGFTRYSDCASSKDHGNVLCFVYKRLIFKVKLRRSNLMLTALLISQVFKTMMLHCLILRSVLYSPILRNLFQWLLVAHVNSSNLLRFHVTQTGSHLFVLKQTLHRCAFVYAHVLCICVKVSMAKCVCTNILRFHVTEFSWGHLSHRKVHVLWGVCLQKKTLSLTNKISTCISSISGQN